MPGTSRSNAFDVALVALSARALARSARRAGLRALTFDLFADSDTQEHAEAAVRVAPARRGFGFDRRALLEALREHASEGLPVVFGAGLEHQPRLMAEIGRRNPILGAAPDLVARLKDPFAFAKLLSSLGVAHPEVAREGGDGWLSKRIGASGGWHIRERAKSARGRYAQRRVDGRPVSALFLADGREARLIGYSEQWTDPAGKTPYRYGGAVGPIELPAQVASVISDGVAKIVAATRLTGLASADFVVGDDGPVLLEINPRPGATLDVFDRGETPSLLALHIEAARGRLPAQLPSFATAQAAAVLYAPSACRAGMIPRPHWTADWPACDEIVPAGAPFCTVLAAGPSPLAARALVQERRAMLLNSLEAAAPATSQKQKVSG